MKYSLFTLFCLISIAGSSQQCKIKFIVRDQDSKIALSDAYVEENKKDIGKTDNDGTYITKSRESGLYTFTIKKNGYEPWEDYTISANPDTTITNPPIYLNSLNNIKTQFFNELNKPKPNVEKTSELYERIIHSYDVLKDKDSKNDFLKEFNSFQKENSLEIKTENGDFQEIIKQNKMRINDDQIVH
jgi:hypothetical protein